MTGFGKAIVNCEDKTIAIEIRTLNSKQLDISTRISSPLRSKENEIRSIITKELERGKIEVGIHVEKSEIPAVTIDENLVKTYFEKFTELSKKVGNKKNTDIFAQVLHLPDIVCIPAEESSEKLWNALFEGLTNACNEVNHFREEEGKTLSEDFELRIQLIFKMIEEITPLETHRMVELKKKLTDSLENMSVKYDQNRFEQELFFYAEKLDITEEKVRLQKHCEYFMETMNEKNAGKKLGFIIQEIGREVNTLGSKANDFKIQQIVVRMKDEVEKIREQLANVL